MSLMGQIKYWADKLAVETEPGLTSAQLMLYNPDLKPVEKQRRIWGAWNYVGFWIADSVNIGTWMISSSMIAGGLSWWQAWLCVWIGYSISAVFIVISGRIGAIYHLSFPALSRASFGVWGSSWPIFNRAAMSCVWYGVVAYIGGQCVYVMIRSIWTSWDAAKMPGSFGTSATNIPEYVSFIIFWLVSLPALWFPVHKLRHLFTAKALIAPVGATAFLIWTLVRAKGAGPIIKQPSSLHGTDLAWEIVKGVMSSIGNFATLIANASDFTRFARKPAHAAWPQLVIIPTSFAITSLYGILVSSSSAVIYGEYVWNPVLLLGKFIDDGGSADRFGVFMIAFALAFAQLGTNISANSVSTGTSLAALVPRYIDIRRGSYICAIVGLAMCPYNFIGSSSKFTTYLSAYSVFLSSITGVIVADYYFVRKGFLCVNDLYNARKTGPYYYTYGVNWRAYTAYICGILINVVGFAGAVGAIVPQGAMYVFQVNFFTGFGVSVGIYIALCKLFPVPETSKVWMEVGVEDEDFRPQYQDTKVPDEEMEVGVAELESKKSRKPA
ncbi:uracil permease [Cordyceps militaris CM01]|uniref:Uracil permease n=1 Tax=Cordyceps militaris (strain CM01) TaxID=983644 RepID=G3J6Q8_CORMM|nr:uracil permease [Cordyceps militaris CM01]EGX95386.1 uracil permease [Cordyceps militaris CM01]